MTEITATNSSFKPSPDHQRLVETAQSFEAIFIRDMIKSMRLSELGEDLLGNSGGSQFRDMMDDQLADKMAASGKGLGIAEVLVAQWQKRL